MRTSRPSRRTAFGGTVVGVCPMAVGVVAARGGTFARIALVAGMQERQEERDNLGSLCMQRNCHNKYIDKCNIR